jgi:hypothetical protein
VPYVERKLLSQYSIPYRSSPPYTRLLLRRCALVLLAHYQGRYWIELRGIRCSQAENSARKSAWPRIPI